MEKLRNVGTQTFSLVCAVLLAVLLVLQFTPFWSFEDGGEQMQVSIGSYIWFPANNDALEDYLSAQIDDHSINDILVPPILVLVLSAVGLVLCVVKARLLPVLLLPLACGIAGMAGMAMPAMQLGAWGWQMALSVLLVLTAGAGLAANWKNH